MISQHHEPSTLLSLIVLGGAVFLGTVSSWAEGAAEQVARGKAIYSGGYARPELLVETDWVEQHRNDPSVRVVDMRGEAAYAAGHLPGAVRIAEGPLRDREDRLTYLPKPDQLAAMMEKAGISNGTHVVVYDDQGGRLAARLWYVLNAFGHERVSLVNGGWNQWAAEKRPTETEVPTVAPTRFTPRQTPTLTCPSPELLARKPGTVVLDTRSPEEFRGERSSSGAAKAGRVPGAVNVEWRENVTGPTLVFKPAEELRKLYESQGVTPDREIIAYCATGGRASHTLFALKLLGYPRVRVYYGSFTDYTARPDAPVER
jgi:thiosulfate/3-mercaptopyruvate sulfurtransferase